jgi:predicted metalloprotease
VRFDDSAVDVSGVNDLRGGRSGGGFGGGAIAMGGGGLGVVGLILYLVLGALGGGGGDFGALGGVPGGTQLSGTGESREELGQRCNAPGAIDEYGDCFLIKVYNEVNEVWDDELARRGADYRPPQLAFFDGAVSTGCGRASSQVGPFYCPPDQGVFIDLGFLDQLQRQFGAEGRYAQAYILAHEVGHHLQTLFGTERQVRAAQQDDPDAANALSVAMELQADCYAGVWSTLADQSGKVAITEADLDEAIGAAEAVGDDRIQQRAQGRVTPESWTHGSAEQRRTWFLEGYRTGDLNACDTFA